MKKDYDLAIFRYYIERGHSIHELLSLSPVEKLFYALHVEMVAEEIEEAKKNGKC